MTSQTYNLYTAAQSQAIDRFAIEVCGIPSFLLMKRAAWFSCHAILEQFPGLKKMVIFCGTGNNGGDGLVLAQFAKLAGVQVEVYLFGKTESLTPDANQALLEWQELGGTYAQLIPAEWINTLPAGENTVLIDALFGTGINRPISGNLAELFTHINQHTSLPVVALDIASGLDASTGNLFGCALKAELTLSFITDKIGFYTAYGQDYSGKILLNDLQLSQEAPQALSSQPPIAKRHGFAYWKHQRPTRPANAHKGTTGTALLIGGNHGMNGAIQLAATAALDTGVGLLKVITPKTYHSALSGVHPEIMCFKKSASRKLLANSSAIGIGPGLGQDKWAHSLFEQVMQTSNRPVTVLDADALNLLAQAPQKHDQWILTPHPGEAARLLGCDTQEIQANRIAAIQQLQKKYGGVVVLKGNGSLIFDGKRLELCSAGNPGMAKGGMGDVLTGTICGFLAQGMPSFDAACLGVWLHATAADKLYAARSEFSFQTSELSHIYADCFRNLDQTGV